MVTALLAVWMFPAVGMAKPLPTPTAEVDPHSAETSSTQQPAADKEAASFAAREQQSPDLANFKGGGVYIYLGSGAALVLLIVLLIILV
ncbi:MAG: hypothetical protein JOZ54_16245 [Acidobacteria bacterium]|nr:hypothetical protein [Acidobacteriota bacterium]